MADLIAECPFHGRVTVSNAVGGSGVMSVGDLNDTRAKIRVGSVLGVCPKCRATAKVVDGLHIFDDPRGMPTLFFPPTPAQAQRLSTVAQWAVKELDAGGDEEKVRARVDEAISKNAPGWKTVLDAVVGQQAQGLYALLALIFAMLAFFGLTPTASHEEPPPTGITEDQMREILDEILERDSGTSTPQREAPTPPAPIQEPPATAPAP